MLTYYKLLFLFSHAFTGEVLRHLSLLLASCAHFQKNEFEVEILYSFTMKETARLIRQIGDKARAQSPVWNKMEWPKRKWLTNEASAVREIGFIHFVSRKHRKIFFVT